MSSILLVPIYFSVRAAIAVPLALDALLVFLVLLDFFLDPSPRQIQVARPLPYPLAVDKPHEILLEVTNRTGISVSLIVHDDFPLGCEAQLLPIKSLVRPGSSTRFFYRLTPMERGNGEFGDIHFWVKGRLRLVWKRGKSLGTKPIRFYPGVALIEKHRLKLRRPVSEDRVRAWRKHGAGTEFESLREYAVGDDSRLIHWPTTARKGKLIVRRNRVERSQNVFIVLDAGRMMTARVLGRTKLDHSLNAALLLAYCALEVGDKVGVMGVGQEVRLILPLSRTPGQFAKILDATYALEARLEEPRFHHMLSIISGQLKRRSLVVIFTDIVDERVSEGLMRYSVGLLPRHLPLLVAMSDTEIIAVADSDLREKRDLYRQGVAAQMLYRREQLLARLSSAGLLVVDSRPEQISVAVLDRYMEIKAKGVL
jgi:uncharacterized protein (DUF58 family)